MTSGQKEKETNKKIEFLMMSMMIQSSKHTFIHSPPLHWQASKKVSGAKDEIFQGSARVLYKDPIRY